MSAPLSIPVTNPAAAFANYFQVNDLRKIVNDEEFKRIAKKATGWFVNQEGDYPYLWIINKEGMNGYALANGRLNLWKGRALHKL